MGHRAQYGHHDAADDDRTAAADERPPRYGEATARLLAEAHRRGIVHRDLKPDNIFLAETDEAKEFVKVLDFGIARAKSVQDVETLTRTGTVAGTPAYVAPEALLGEDVSPAADVYALGLVLYEMFAGHHPFTAETAFKVMRHHLDTVPPTLERVLEDRVLPQGLSDLVARCLAKKPLQRPQDAAALRAHLQSIIQGKGFLSESSVSTDTMELRALSADPPGSADEANPIRRPTGDAHPMATNASLARPEAEAPPELPKRSNTLIYAGLAALLVAALGAAVLLQEPPAPEPAEDVIATKPQPSTPVNATPKEAEPSSAAAVTPEAAEVAAPEPAPKKPAPKQVTPKAKAVTIPVSISSDPEGAVVQQGDTIHGVTPLVIQLPKGEEAVELTVSKAGFVPSKLNVVPDKGHVLETNLKRKSKPSSAKRQKRFSPKPSLSAPKPAEVKKVKAPAVSAKPKPKPKPKPKKRIDVLLD